MADFIIKPTTGNLILKDDQNVARITIAPTTGATTLSNISSASTFPAGYVIQTANGTMTGEGSPDEVSHTGAWADTGLSASITNLRQANAKVLISYSQSTDYYNSDSGSMVDCWDSIASGTYAEIVGTQTYHLNQNMVSAQWFQFYHVCSGFLKTLSNTANDSYAVKVRCYETAGSVYTHAGNGEGSRRSQITIQEIAI